MQITDDKEPINRETTGLRQQPYNSYYNSLIENETNIDTNHLFNQQVYDKLLRDDQVHASVMQRIASVVGSGVRVVRGGDDRKSRAAADYVEQMIKHLNWDDICHQMLMATFYGFSIAENLMATDGNTVFIDKIKVRKRDDYAWNINERPVFIGHLESEKNDVELVNPYFWWCRFGSAANSELYGRGLAHQVYYPVIFKHAAINYNLDFLDKFANPSVIGKLSEFDNDPNSAANFRATIEALHGSGGTVLKNGESIEVLESLRTGAAYEQFIDWCDAAISKSFLGQSMTIEDGTSRSFGKTMLEIRAERAKMDDNMVSGSFNRQIIPHLIRINFPGAKNPKIERDLDVREDIEAQSRADIRVFQLGYKPTKDYIERVYGKGWEVDESRGQELKPEDGAYQNRADGSISDAITDKTDLSDDDSGLGADPVELSDKFISGQLEVDKIADNLAKNLPDSLDKAILPVLMFVDKYGPQKTLDKLSKLAPESSIDDLLNIVQSANELSAAIGRTGK